MYATLDNGGWYSVTTKKKLNSVLNEFNVSIVQKSFIWYIYDKSNGKQFQNGMVLAV